MTIDQFRRSTEIDNGKALTIVPDWRGMAVIPTGMRVTECPQVPRSFADEFNLQVCFGDEKNTVDANTNATQFRPRHPKSSVGETLAMMKRIKVHTRSGSNATTIGAPRSGTSTIPEAGYRRPALNPIQMCLDRARRPSHPSHSSSQIIQS